MSKLPNKRTHEEDEPQDSPAAKRRKIDSTAPEEPNKGPSGIDGIPIYDFTAETGFTTKAEETPLSTLRPPSPKEELQRARLIEALRKLYGGLCLRKLDIEPPSESFNRWLLAQLSATEPTTRDPLLRRPELAVETGVVSDQLNEALPASAYVSWGQRRRPEGVLGVARSWVHAARRWLGRSGGDPALHERAKAALAKAEGDWLSRGARLSSGDEAMKYFGELREECAPFFREKCRQAVDEVLRKLVSEARTVTSQLEAVATADGEKDKDSRVSIQRAGANYQVKFENDTQHVTQLHHDKLHALWDIHAAARAASDTDAAAAAAAVAASPYDFETCLWMLLRRYATLFGATEGRMEGASFHAAAPETFFSVLRRGLGVGHECFASPFNCYFRSFCSAFPDTDRPFGSKGSFFSFRPTSGSFEVGPPYTVEVMDNTARWVETLLQGSELPLSFVVCVPDWRTPLQPGQERMEASPFLRQHFVADGRKHAYVVGHQHIPSNASSHRDRDSKRPWDRMFVLPFKTHIYLLQNEEGAKQWPITTDTLRDMQDALEKAAGPTR